MDLDFSGDYDYDERVCGETSSKSYTYNNESENISWYFYYIFIKL